MVISVDFFITRILLQITVLLKSLTGNRINLQMIVNVLRLVPPSFLESSETDQVSPTAPFLNEFTPPLVQHLIEIEFYAAFRLISY